MEHENQPREGLYRDSKKCLVSSPRRQENPQRVGVSQLTGAFKKIPSLARKEPASQHGDPDSGPLDRQTDRQKAICRSEKNSRSRIGEAQVTLGNGPSLSRCPSGPSSRDQLCGKWADMPGSRRMPSPSPEHVLLLKLIHHTLKQIPGVGELEPFSVD